MNRQQIRELTDAMYPEVVRIRRHFHENAEVSEHEYETCGIYEGCVFPTGTVVKDGTLYVYYGTADTYIGLATADFNELVNYLMTECKI